MRYRLIAITKDGASIQYFGNTRTEALSYFDRSYDRKGFKIKIWDHVDEIVYTIKKTYR